MGDGHRIEMTADELRADVACRLVEVGSDGTTSTPRAPPATRIGAKMRIADLLGVRINSAERLTAKIGVTR
jgi:hypothetical protein